MTSGQDTLSFPCHQALSKSLQGHSCVGCHCVLFRCSQNRTKPLLTQSQPSTNGLVGHDSSKSRVLTITPLGCHGSYNKTIGNLKQLIRNNFIQHRNQIHLNMICKNSKFHFSGGLILGNNITFTNKY